jgi:hypothetical protein
VDLAGWVYLNATAPPLQPTRSDWFEIVSGPPAYLTIQHTFAPP